MSLNPAIENLLSTEDKSGLYPGCPNAVSYLETEEIEVGLWSPSRSALSLEILTIEEVLGGLKHAAETIYPTIRQEMDHPDFVRYVAAKLGVL